MALVLFHFSFTMARKRSEDMKGKRGETAVGQEYMILCAYSTEGVFMSRQLYVFWLKLQSLAHFSESDLSNIGSLLNSIPSVHNIWSKIWLFTLEFQMMCELFMSYHHILAFPDVQPVACHTNFVLFLYTWCALWWPVPLLLPIVVTPFLQNFIWYFSTQLSKYISWSFLYSNSVNVNIFFYALTGEFHLILFY